MDGLGGRISDPPLHLALAGGIDSPLHAESRVYSLHYRQHASRF